MKTIRVGFSRGGSPYSWIIRLLTWSRISHTYQRVDATPGEQMIFQASGFKVNYENSKIFDEHSEVVEEYDVHVTEEQAAGAELIRVQECGKPYGMLQVVGYVWVILWRAFKVAAKNPLADGKHSHVCVELTARQIGLSGAESMTPEDLRRWCEANAHRVV